MISSGEDRIADTIVGIATPPGTGAIGVIRVSGPGAISVVSSVLRLSVSGGLDACKERVLHRGVIIDPLSGTDVDVVLVVKMLAPRSYTADDVVEISCHGNPVVLAQIVGFLVERGARLAQPGEFTRRAYLNGRMNLLQVEAVAELISARSERAARLAARQLTESLANQVDVCRELLLDLVAGLEVALDFPEEEFGILRAEASKKLRELYSQLDPLVVGARRGRMVQDGLTMMLTGAPNVGKSSLLNALLERPRAIVSEIPGTTRDLLEGTLTIHGVPVRLLDGAGLGMPRDDLDLKGMRLARHAIEESDLVLVVLDASRPTEAVDEEILAFTATRPRLVIANKSDLAPALPALERRLSIDCACSALTGAGVGALQDLLSKWVIDRTGPDGEEGGIVASLRVLEHLIVALQSIDSAGRRLDEVPLEAILVDLKNALTHLNRILGTEADEAVLDRIFATFCVGK